MQTDRTHCRISDVWQSIKTLQTTMLNFPSQEHCSGEGKLLGTGLAPALDRWLGGSAFDVDLAIELCKAMRAWLVIDDFRRDTVLSPKQNLSISELLDRLEVVILELGTSSFCEFASIWHRRKRLQEFTYSTFDLENFYVYKINKCSLAFWYLDLAGVRESNRYPLLQKGLHDYFFALSLADDFNDMEEDINAPRNDNLFVGGQNCCSAGLILQRRPLILRALIPFVLTHLKSFDALQGDFGKYYAHACIYLEKNIPRSLECVEGLFSDSFENFNFDPRPLECRFPAGEHMLCKITAEDMHTHVESRPQRSSGADMSAIN